MPIKKFFKIIPLDIFEGMRHISSTANPEIKHLLQIIEKSKSRRQEQLFAVEGERLLSRAIACGYTVVSIYCLPETVEHWHPYSNNIIIVNPNIMSRISVMQYDVVAILKQKNHNLDDSFAIESKGICLVLSGLEKPGNIGAILRTADASGVNSIFISSENADLYNPHCLRNSTGAIFGIDIALGDARDIVRHLHNIAMPIYTTHLEATHNYTDIDYRQGAAIVMGTEAIGVDDYWVDSASVCIKIPMKGVADSLNVSTSAAVILYEALRQRSLS